jgi:nucleoside-diphosphate-sugar epimerase
VAKSCDDKYFREDFSWRPKYDIRNAIMDFLKELREKTGIYL